MKTLLTAVLLALSTLTAVAQEPSTSKQYYQELKTAGGLPKWAVNVCFIQDSGDFLLMSDGPNEHYKVIQGFYQGVGAHVLPFIQQETGILMFSGVNQAIKGKDKTYKLEVRINWTTGRFSETDSFGTEEHGTCEAIQ